MRSPIARALSLTVFTFAGLVAHGCGSSDSSDSGSAGPTGQGGSYGGSGGSAAGGFGIGGAAGKSAAGGSDGSMAGGAGAGGTSGGGSPAGGQSGSPGAGGGADVGGGAGAGGDAGAGGTDAGGSGGSGGSAGASGSAGSGDSGAGGAAGAGGAMMSTVALFDKAHIGSDGSKPDFHVAEVMFELPAGPYTSVKLVTDLTSPCFPFTNWNTDKPPAGQNWPADCDAFDRNYEFTLDEPAAMTDPPAIELIRAITPFGGPEHLEADVTDVMNGLPGKHRLRVTIPSYSDGAGKVSGSNGGWFVSAHLEVTTGPAPHQVLAVTPLFNGSFNGGPDPADIPFSVPAGTTSARIEYRATGHGGGNTTDPACIGPAEEFCKRMHHLTIDATEVLAKDLWRTDCATLCTAAFYAPFNLHYCAQDPCGDMNSVKAPRANWCPGSMTPPELLTDGPLLTAGNHTFRYQIPSVAMGGTWRVSAVLIALGD